MPRDTSARSREAAANIRLDSWKEIAAYLRCGVRSAQRWEKTEGLPVHRHVHQTQGSIYAFTSEIDEWRNRRSSAPAGPESPAGHPPASLPPVVGRHSELVRLDAYWSTALAGTRQVVFVTGTIGVGKTALVRAFLGQLESPRIIHGDCVEQFGAGEPYLPIIEGLTRLLRGPTNERPVGILAKYAHSWVMHIPDFPRRSAIADAAGPRPDRMAREFIDAIEALSHERPVVLLLEDLHWADRSTVELIDRIARRRDEARILVIGTYRLEEWADQESPLSCTRHELLAHGLCHQIRLSPFSEEELSQYLTQRGAWTDLTGATRELQRWTGGVPLFVNILIDHLIDTKRLTLTNSGWTLIGSVQKDPPLIAPTIRDLIDDRVRRLSPDEQRLLEAASVAGHSFFAAPIAAALRVGLEQAEHAFESLGRRHQFVARQNADDPSDVVAAKYAFLHSLYQHVIYERLAPTTQMDLHREMGLFLEPLHASGREDLSTELAMHFERARDFKRAAFYYEASADTALARGANYEAHRSALRVLDQLAKLHPDSERDRQELNVKLKICAAVSNISTMADPQVEHAYREALTLCERLGDDAQVIPALLGIVRFHAVRGNVETSRRLAERALTISRATGDPVLRVQALHHVAVADCSEGRFTRARAYATEAIDASREIPSAAALLTSGFHTGPAALTVQSWASWFLGYPDQAYGSARDAVALATELSHPQTLAFTQAYSAVTCEWCGIGDQSQSWAEASLALAKKCELPFAIAFVEGVLGWILGRRGSVQGADAVSRSIQLQSSIGVNLWIPVMSAWLAENLLHAGNVSGAGIAIDEGLKVARQFGITQYDAELKGLRAEVLAATARDAASAVSPGVHGEAPEELAKQSFSIAAAQQARSLQLRAAIRLLRLATTNTRFDEAYDLLSDTYGSFSEGLATPDLLEARALLDSVRIGTTLK